MIKITGAKLYRMFYTPLSTMSGAALLVIASARCSYAIVTLGSLLWVHFLCTLINSGIQNVFQKISVKMLGVLISAFIGSLYLLFLYLVNPFLALETSLLCSLVPVYYIGNWDFESFKNTGFDAVVSDSWKQPLSLGCFILAFSFIREPLGFATLSVPGGERGIIQLFNAQQAYPFPVELISSAAGALFLLAYILIVLRYLEGGSKGDYRVKEDFDE
jgi:hypothetical protein